MRHGVGRSAPGWDQGLSCVASDNPRVADTGCLFGPRTDTIRHFFLTTGSWPWSFWRQRVPRQSASALGPHDVHRPSKALEGYSPFKTTVCVTPCWARSPNVRG